MGIELKTLGDLLSSLKSGRLGGRQIPGIVHYYDVPYLMIHSLMRAEPRTGILQQMIRRRGEKKGRWRDVRIKGEGWTYDHLWRWLWSIEIQSGVRIRTCSSEFEACLQLVAIHHSWMKPWDGHKSLKVFDSSGCPPLADRRSLTLRWAKELPNIGWTKAAAVAARFDSPWEMANAEVEELMEAKGVGKTIASRAVEEIRRGS